MGYSSEVIRRARQRLESAKADRESENRQNEALAYAQVPRLREIDRELRMTMAQAIGSVFASGGDVQEAMKEAREKNLNLQLERRELIAANFPEGFLDDEPICDKCGGSGYIGTSMCECLAELCRQEQKKELTFLMGQEKFEQFRLDYYPDCNDPKLGVNIRVVMEKTLNTCRRYAINFTEKSPNLLFSGDTGLGKTFLSACIARTVADSGYSVVYESANHLFSNMEMARFNGDAEAQRDCRKYTACDLLIVDDLGTEMSGQFVTASLYALINDRILSGKPTIISTNLTVEDLNRRYSPQIVSRLMGNFIRVPFLGEDIRVKKNWGF